MKELEHDAAALDANQSELSEEELDAVAGGTGFTKPLTPPTTSTGSGKGGAVDPARKIAPFPPPAADLPVSRD